MIVPLNLPKANLKLKRRNEEVFVWSILRKKDLLLTPEEWVRQHIIHFLINEQGVAPGLITPEFTLEYNGRSKRADLVIFDTNGHPRLIVECKAPDVEITEETLFQIAQYNHQLGVEHLMMSNGIQHIYCRVDKKTGELFYYEEFPENAL